MKGISLGFLLVGLVSVTIGMVWGIYMAKTGNHVTSPAHAHLNLIGFVIMAIAAFYYHNVPAAAEKMLAKIHLGVAVLGEVLIVPGIAMAVTGKGETLAAIGSFITLAAMLIFLVTALMNARKA